MGKGSKRRKKKRRRKLYNKTEFVNIFCEKCGMCEGDPTFCYSDIYKNQPHLFVTKVYKHLLEVKGWNELRHREGISMMLDAGQFRYSFCTALEQMNACGIDTTNCDHLGTCYALFRAQIFGEKQNNRYKVKRKKKKQKKTKYIAKPYPTLIISKDEKWEKFVKDTLSDGNIDREQNKTETGTV